MQFYEEPWITETVQIACTWWFAHIRNGTRRFEDMDLERFVLSVDDDTEFRSRCE
jgi:hypothetical protein